MGNQQRTPEEEYRRYARPEPGRAGDWVEVIDDGGGRQIEAGHTAGPPYGAVENPDSTGTANVTASASAGPSPQQRRNWSLWAAWALVALMLVLGLGWLFGFVASPWDDYQAQASGSGLPETQSQELRLNLYTLGPSMTAAGVLGAVILLAVQATMFHRSPRAH
ncbi:MULTISPECIES: hypothetical protein [unclassified Arthrobacter]|uniref:hypothetical protein n=1 Tax=unclassified Arthrobacter TaxID=235627 RepID=UPI000CE32572|nr:MULTISPECIES: hypothetical protein [unclassified Arthrobacter]